MAGKCFSAPESGMKSWWPSDSNYSTIFCVALNRLVPGLTPWLHRTLVVPENDKVFVTRINSTDFKDRFLQIKATIVTFRPSEFSDGIRL